MGSKLSRQETPCLKSENVISPQTESEPKLDQRQEVVEEVVQVKQVSQLRMRHLAFSDE